MSPQYRAALLARATRQGTSRAEVEAIAAVLGAGGNRPRMLRRAHSGVYRLRQAREPVPFWLRVLESEYQGSRRKPRPRPEGLLAGILYDERTRRAA